MTDSLARFAGWAERTADRLAASVWPFCAAFAILFLPLTLLWSSRRPLWSDEVYTVYISRAPALADIWNWLALGADLQPPLIFVATRLAQRLFGTSEWAIRLPGTLGFLLMGLCLLGFVARRTNAWWGFVAALFVLLCGAFKDAAEARPYGLILGFAAAALLCWQSAASGQRRRFSLTGLCASLMLALFTHYYAFLIFFPIALGELVRTWVRRKIDWPVWGALLASSLALLALFPLLKHSLMGISGAGVNYFTPVTLLDAYRNQLGSAGAKLAIAGALVSGLICRLAPMPQKQRAALPLHEAAAVVGLIAVPLPAFLLAATVTHRPIAHYAMILVLGLAAFFAFATHKLAGGRSAAALLLALVMTALFAGHTLRQARAASLESAEPVSLDTLYRDLPIVVSSGLEFVQAWYYASPELRSRILFVSDPKMALRYLHNEQTNSSIPFDARFFHWRYQTYDDFLRSQPRFLLHWTGEDSWLPPALRERGARCEFLETTAGGDLYLVTL